ncbi:hypothetical protein ACIQ7N_11340 [Lysinibacillus sp. NPDC095746]|uniref:hypothetical protein n=1 Tax=Lysinibacillus sp. NPDC095746 TaxID=3364134 RepID=UPI00382B76B8
MEFYLFGGGVHKKLCLMNHRYIIGWNGREGNIRHGTTKTNDYEWFFRTTNKKPSTDVNKAIDKKKYKESRVRVYIVRR